MRLTSDQIDVVRDAVDSSGITIESLRDDLHDHLCCAVEVEMNKGRSFEDALQFALQELAPAGLRALENEALFLLNANKIIIMKKIMYFVGFLGVFAMTIGTMFKWLHWVGSDELYMGGFFTVTLLFAPLATIDHYKVGIARALSENVRVAVGLISALSAGVGVLLKINDMHGGDYLLLGGTVLFAFGFLPFYFFTLYRRSVD